MKKRSIFILLFLLLTILAYSNEKKKIIVIQATDYQFVVEGKQNILKTLAEKGFDKNSSDIYELYIGENLEDEKGFVTYDKFIKKVDEINPDVILVMGANTGFLDNGIDKLRGMKYPVVVNIWAERYVDIAGNSTENITGIYMMSDELQQNAFKLLNDITPLNGKEAVFLTGFKAFEKSRVSKNIKEAINGELKDLLWINNLDELEEEMNKYNADKDIAWILHGYNVGNYKDGKFITWTEALRQYNRRLQKKPNVTYWETVVKEGAAVAGLCADIAEDGIAVAEMGVEILQGKDIKDLQARSPREQKIILNLQHASDIGIEIPYDILAGAYRVYTDYDGNYIEQ